MKINRNEACQSLNSTSFTSFPLTATIVNPKNQEKSLTITTLPPGFQNSSNSVGESPDSLNLFSRASSRAGK